jgi:hypothetical protein
MLVFHYRFVFFAIVGMYYIQTVCAMELVQHRDTKNDIAIEMYHVWSDDYTKDVTVIKKLNFESIRSRLENENYLASDAKALHHLLYLSTIDKNDNTIKTLFTYKQQNKFDAALKIKRSVPWCFGINGAVIICTSFLPFTNLVGLSQCSNATQSECLSPLATIMTPGAVTLIGSLILGFVSLYATGLSPDISSRRADKVQDEICYLNHNYETIAKYWIDMHFDCPEKARDIAERFDIDELKMRSKLKTNKTKSGGSLVRPLEEACHFIKHNTVLITFTAIENYIHTKIHGKNIEGLEKRIELLETMVHKKDVEIEKLKQEKI